MHGESLSGLSCVLCVTPQWDQGPMALNASIACSSLPAAKAPIDRSTRLSEEPSVAWADKGARSGNSTIAIRFCDIIETSILFRITTARSGLRLAVTDVQTRIPAQEVTGEAGVGKIGLFRDALHTSTAAVGSAFAVIGIPSDELLLPVC
jgi:hypothetical protein